MENLKETTVVFDDTLLFGMVCGVHDENIVALEHYGKVTVRVRGNELIIPHAPIDRLSIIEKTIERMTTLARESMHIHPEIVRSIIEGYENPASSTPSGPPLIIPQGSTRVHPRTANQSTFLTALKESNLVLGIGPAGTGKTYLAIAHALVELLSHKKRKLILTRPVVEVGESLGYLPGDLTQKLDPYIKPLYDAMESLIPGELINRLQENRMIELAPLAYMRGRSLKDCCVVLDEAQNTTREQMKMFLTRLGENTQAIITGDITQVDLPQGKPSGLIQAMKILEPIPEVSIITFEKKDVVRSSLVRKIIEAYEQS